MPQEIFMEVEILRVDEVGEHLILLGEVEERTPILFKLIAVE
jgi:hypothetical protein